MQQPDPVYVFRGSDPVHSLAFFNQNILIGCGSEGKGSMIFFCLSSLRVTYEMKIGDSPVLFIATNDETLYTFEKSGVLKTWELEKSGYKISKEIVTGHTGFARPQHLPSNDKNLLLVPFSESDFSVIDLNAGCELPDSVVKAPDGARSLMCLKPMKLKNETKVLASYESGHLVLFDLKQRKPLQLLKLDFGVSTFDYDIRGLMGGPNNVTVCHFGIDREHFELYRDPSNDISYVPKTDDQVLAGISVIKNRPDKFVFIVGTCDGHIHVHSHATMRKFATLKNHKAEITDVSFSPTIIDNYKKNVMACASLDGSVSFWTIYSK